MDTPITKSQKVSPYSKTQAIPKTDTCSSASSLPSQIENSIAVQIPQVQAMHQADYLQLCQQIVQSTLNSPNLATTLHKVAITLSTTFQVEGCLIAIGDQHSYQSNNWLVGYHPTSPAPPTLLEHPAIKLMLANSTPTVVLDTHANSWDCQWNETEIQAILGTTIQYQNNSTGVIVLMRSQPHAWTDVEIEVLKAASSQVAVTVAQKLLHDQQQKQSQYRSVVNQLTLAIRNSVELSEILEQAISGTAQALQVDRGLILRLKYWDSPLKGRSLEQIPKAKATVVCEWANANNSQNEPVVSTGENHCSPKTWLDYSFWVSECGLCQQLLLNSPPAIVVNNKEEGSIYSNGIAPIFDLDTMPALLLLPLESQNTILGFLALQQSRPRIWQAEELELVELVGAQISTAIIQTETLRQVQALVDKRTVQLRQSLELQSKLYEKTRQQIDQLRHLNHLKDEFIDTISHELRTPLTSMTMAIRMLREVDLPPERSAKYLDILEQQCAQEINLVNDLLALQELESRQVAIQLQDVDLTELLEDAAQTFRQRWESKGLSLKLQLSEPEIILQTDLNSLKSILYELLTNAGKYSDPNCEVRLQVVWQRAPAIEQVVISLHNRGRGISEEELPLIFDKFRRGQGATQNAIQGTGLGLALVKSLVQHINGTIEVTSQPASNQPTFETCFTLTLPHKFDPAKL
jgi:signal transduction histidine kinase